MRRHGNDRQGHSTDRRQFLRTVGALSAAGVAGTGRGAGGRSISSKEYTVTSADGTEIAVTLYTPATTDPAPAVLLTHGWGGFRTDPITTALALPYVDHGYVVAAYDSRGFNDSGGTSTLNGPKEVTDARRLIDWLAGRPEVETVSAGNPRLGMDGLSYGGGIQPLVAAADDRVDAIVPRIAWHDLADSFVPNGVVKSAWLTVLLGVGAIGTYDWWDGPRLLDDLTDWYVEALSRNTLPEDAADAFDERSISSTLEDLDTPTLSIHGLDDTLFGPPQGLRTYRGLQERGVESRLLLYGGGHTLSELTVPLDSRSYMTRQTLDWMDRHLRGADTDVPQVGTSLQQRGEWRTNEQFPPADVSRTGLAFDAAERVGDNTVKRKSLLWDSWVTYHWERPADVEVIGAPELELSLDVYGPEARLFVRFLQDGTPINGVRGTARVDGPGHQRITLSYPSLQRFVAGGETIGLQVSVTDSLHSDSRFSDGVTIYEAESVARVPTRPQ